MQSTRDDGLQQIIIILMMVVFAIFNFVADRLRRRSGAGTEPEEPLIVIEDEAPGGYDRETAPASHGDWMTVGDGEQDAAPASDHWWERPAPATYDRTASRHPERAQETTVQYEEMPVVVPQRTPEPVARVERAPRPIANSPLPRIPDRVTHTLRPGAKPLVAPRERIRPTARISAAAARRGIVVMTVLGRCRGLEPVGTRGALLLLALLGAAACASTPAGAPAPRAEDAGRAPQGAPGHRGVVIGDAAAIARARADSARYPYTAADIHFMTAMIHHHAQAIEIARWAPANGASDPIRRLAARIISSQEDEIVTMQQWLADRNQAVPEPDPAGMPMEGHGGHRMLMPGMLDERQLRELREARGAGFDRFFLTLMIQHHQGAITMVEQLFGSHGAGQDEAVFRFASDVHVDQVTEIERMRRMLADLTLTPTQ
jgi:uncharacterized protein (DUF305 family)